KNESKKIILAQEENMQIEITKIIDKAEIETTEEEIQIADKLDSQEEAERIEELETR
ncbi:3817_t:CDS:1, partial [Scutellospora calospora]